MFLLPNKDNELVDALLFLKNDVVESEETDYVESTEMYKISRIIKGLQHTTKYNVVRVWGDTMAETSSIENGRFIVNTIIHLESVEKLKISKA